MTESILNSTKKVLGLDPTYDVFDVDIIMHINSVFGTLQQLGIGPPLGFAISDDTATWDEFLAGDLRFNSVKTYMVCKVRLVFDPPGTSFAIEALKEIIREHEVRLSIERENIAWVPPVVIVTEDA